MTNDFKISNKVVQDNTLIRSMWRMDGVAIKIFEMAVSCIDVEKPPKDNTVYISKKDLFKFMGVQPGSKDKYTRFRVHLKKLQSQVIVIKSTPGNRWLSVVPVPTIEFGTDKNDQVVRIVFNPEIMPYLINLRHNFTQYEIGQLLYIRKKYSLILFQLAICEFKRSPEPFMGSLAFKVDMDYLRDLTDTKNELKVFGNFEQRVLKDSVAEINGAYTEILMSYDKIKDGRKITGIRFKVRKRLSFEDKNFDDPVPLSV